MCAIEPEKLAMSRKGFLEELERAEQLQIKYLVMHPGSHLGAGEEAGIKAIAESFHVCWDQTDSKHVKVLLETTAGQGTNLGYTFEQIARMLELVDYPERMGVCLDTCHILAAGYDYRTPEGYERVMADFDKIIGLDKLGAIHINDSKKDFATRVDRHEHIGEGFVGSGPFRFFLNDSRLATIAGLLETPGEMPDYARNLATLRSLIQ
jgi:deoxyribonuclease-4